jgi:hypothetical protein
MSRDIYLVGSVPMASAREVFEKVSAALGTRIKRLPDGETGERADWITWLEPVFSEHTAFQKSGEFFRVHATGTGRERYTLKPGIKPQDVRFENLFYAEVAKRSYAEFKRLKMPERFLQALNSRSIWSLRIRLSGCFWLMRCIRQSTRFLTMR